MLSSVNQYFVNNMKYTNRKNLFVGKIFFILSLRPQNVTKQTINYFKTN